MLGDQGRRPEILLAKDHWRRFGWRRLDYVVVADRLGDDLDLFLFTDDRSRLRHIILLFYCVIACTAIRELFVRNGVNGFAHTLEPIKVASEKKLRVFTRPG